MLINNYNNKKAQVGETITWFIATIAIVLILIFFTFGASYLAKAKNTLSFGENAFSKAQYRGDDIYLKKSIYTELTASSKDAFDIGNYILNRDKNKTTEYELPANVTIKRIRNNLNKK